MRTKTTTPTMPIQAHSIPLIIEEIQNCIKSLKAVMEKLCDLSDHLVAEEYNSEILDTICDLQGTISFLKYSQISKAA